ncbi:MAG: hypothetical protein J5I94_03700 [Phaeodactylibacter sp.]|nr:hypothetical protein [Phaeodactylibacter sp.]
MQTQKTVIGILAVILAILAVIIYQFCGTETIDDTPPIQRDRIIAPISFVFYDAASPSSTNVENVKVTIIDSLGQVRTSGGLQLSEINLTGGVMTLGLKEGTQISGDAPYGFSVMAEASGYADVLQTITVTKASPQHVPIYMANLEAPPPGIAAGIQPFPIAGSSLSQPVNISVPVERGGAVQVTIPEGTKLLCDGEPINAEGGSLRVAYGDPLSPAAAQVFPNGPVVTNAVGRNGEIVASLENPGYFNSLGWATIDIQAGDGEVNGFSDSVTISLPVSRELINPETNEPYFVGQQVPVWSLNERTGVWKEELSSPLEYQGEFGPLVARFKVTHLSTWNLDFKVDICTSVSFTVNNTGCEVALASTVSLAGGGLPPFTRTRLLNYPEGVHEVELRNIPDTDISGGTLTFTVYDDNDVATPTNPFPETVGLNSCTPSVPNINISPSITGAACNLFGLELAFAEGTGSSAVAIPLCNDALYFRPTSGGSWNVAGYCDNTGLARMTHLDSGTDYRFRVPFVDGGGTTVNIEFTLTATARSFADCGPDMTTVLNISPTLPSTIIKKCISSGGTGCPGSGGGSFNCSITGTNVNSARGMYIQVMNVASGLVPMHCSS